jgi:hypothetical protein
MKRCRRVVDQVVGGVVTVPARLPAACDAPTAIAASSLVSPLAISRQNKLSTSRRSDGTPGDFIGDLPVSAFIHPAGLPIDTYTYEVLRRPVEFTLRTSVRVPYLPLVHHAHHRGISISSICWSLRVFAAGPNGARGRSRYRRPGRLPVPGPTVAMTRHPALPGA